MFEIRDTTADARLPLEQTNIDAASGKQSGRCQSSDATANDNLQPMDGFTPDQRFFLGFAQVWCEHRSEEYSRLLATVDPHSPGQFRVNGVVQNMPEFQKAFSCKAGQPMVRQNACRVW